MKSWILASRPRTLPAAVVPVLIGSSMAWQDGGFHGTAALIALLCSLLIQIGTNFVNDYSDFKKGTDNEERLGPLRVAQAGLIKPEVLVKGAILVFGLAVLAAVWLIIRGGWPIALIGITSILAGIFYTAGPKPYGYIGLGDIFVFVFFGPVAVWGTYYVQTLSSSAEVIIAGAGAGMISTAILAVNNIRDVEGDRKSGKKSLVVRFGRSFGIAEYYFLISAASLVPVVLIMLKGASLVITASFAPLFFIQSIRDAGESSDGPVLNRALENTGRMLLVYGLLMSAGWLVRF